MNNNINLCKILSGFEGIKIYCLLTGEDVIFEGCSEDNEYVHIKDCHGHTWTYPKEGYKYLDYPHGECMLVPSKGQWDWSKFELPELNEFNLEKAKNGAPVCLKDGRKVNIIKFDLNNSKYSILGIVKNSDGTEDTMHWQNNGQLMLHCKTMCDLIMDSE